MKKIELKNVGKNVAENVEGSVDKRRTSQNPRYVKGKFANTLKEVSTKILYVRKSVSVNQWVTDEKTGKEKFVKQKQYWRICDPPTQKRVNEILADIQSDLEKIKPGKRITLFLFSDIADSFEKSELTEAVFQNERKISGKLQTRLPKIFIKQLVKFFGDSDINDISFEDIAAYKRKRLKEPIKSTKGKVIRDRSIRSVNYELAVLKQIFNYAVRHRWLLRNPFMDGKNLIDTTQENKRSLSWTREEEKAALSFCTGIYFHMKVVIICICDGGFRKNELLSAK